MTTHDDYMTRRQARDLARRLARLERKTRSTAAAHADLRHSAIDGGKGLVLKDEDGNEKYRLGTDENGVTAPQFKGGPTPEQPSEPFVDVGGEVVKIQHSGLDVDENPAPADFRRAQIHVAQTETFEPSLSTLAGYLEEADGSFTHRLPGGEWYVGIVWETLSGKTSVMSESVLADIPPLVDAQDIQDTLDTAQERLDEYRDEVAAPRFQALEDGLSENADNLADARTRLSAAEQTLSPLPGEVAEARDFAEGAIESAEAAEARVVEAMANIQTVLPNGGFEAGLTNWESQGANLGSTTVHSGDQSVWLQANGWIRPEDPIAVREDQVWDLGFYYYFSVSNRHTLVTVEAVDDQDGRTELEQWTLSGLTGGQWHHTGPLRFEVPAGVSRVSFTISYVDHIVFVDNVALRDVTDVVRLERAATTARQAAEEAITRIEFMELAVDGEGGIRDQIADARDMLAEKADTSRLNELDGKLAQLGWDVTKVWRQDTPPPSGITYEWSDGEPHAAPSVQKVDGVDAAWNYMPNPSFESALETLSVGSRTTVGRTQFSSGVSSGQHGLTIAIAAGANNANAYIAQSFDVSPEMHGKWVGWSLLMRRSGLGLTAVRPYVTWGSVSDTQWMAGFELTDAPLLEQPRHVYAIQVPVGATRVQIWYRFTATPTGGSPSAGNGHADDWVITVADTEDAALSGAAKYWDGSSPDDRQNDLWYDSDGVPHFWLKGWGWAVLEDERLEQLNDQLGTVGERLDTAETDLETALEGPIDHDRLRVGTGAFDTAFASKLIADHATIINAAMRNLSVEEKLLFAEAIGDQIWAELGVFDRLDAREAYVGGAHLKDGAVTAEKIHATRELITKIMGAEWAYIAQQLIVDGSILTRDLEALSAAIQSLTVTQRADIAQLWAEELWTALAVIEELQAEEAWITSAMIEELTAEKVTVTENFVGRVAELLHLVVDRIDANALWADQTWQAAGHFGSEDADQKTEVDGTGVTLYRFIDGELIPAAQFGGGLTQLAFFDGNDSVGSIDQHGNAAFQQLAAKNLTVAGREVFPPNPAPEYEGYLFDALPRGIRDKAVADMGRFSDPRDHYGFLEVSAQVEAGREYRIRNNAFRMSSGNFYYASYKYTFSTTGTPPAAPHTESDELTRWSMQRGDTGTEGTPGEHIFTANQSGIMRILLVVSLESGSGITFHPSSIYTTVTLTLEDIGPARDYTGMRRYAAHGSGNLSRDNQPLVQGLVTSWQASWMQTYEGNAGNGWQISRPGLNAAIQGLRPSTGTYYATILGGYPTSPAVSGDDAGQTMAEATNEANIISARIFTTGVSQPLSQGATTNFYWHAHGQPPTNLYMSSPPPNHINRWVSSAGATYVTQAPDDLLQAIQNGTFQGFTMHPVREDGARPAANFHGISGLGSGGARIEVTYQK